MTKIVYNSCYGGFGLSNTAEARYKDAKGLDPSNSLDVYAIQRHDPVLVQIVEDLGDNVNSNHSDLCIAEIEGNKYRIDEYDGLESVEVPAQAFWEIIDTPELRDEFPEDYL